MNIIFHVMDTTITQVIKIFLNLMKKIYIDDILQITLEVDND